MEARKLEGQDPTKVPISETLKVHESCKGTGDRETMESFRSSSEKLNIPCSDIKDEDDVPVKEGKAPSADRASPVIIPVATDSVTIVREKPARSTSGRTAPKKSRSLSRSRKTGTEAAAASSSATPSAPSSGPASRSESASGLFQYQPAPVLLPSADRPPVPAYVTRPLQLGRSSPPSRERDVELEGDCFSYEDRPPALSPESEAAAAAAMSRPPAAGLDLSAFLAPLRLAEVSRDVPALGHASDDEPLGEDELAELERAGANSALVQRLRLRNAKLEGKMEVLSRESDITLRERAELASNLSVLRTQVKEVSSSRALDASVIEKIREELRATRQAREDLDAKLARNQLVMEEKSNETKGLMEELESLRQANNEMVFRVKELEGSAGAKESTIGTLKSKVAELFMQVESGRQVASQLDKEASSLRVELSSAQKSKQWYQQQLEATQEARNRLQSETAKIQAMIAEGARSNDGLASENSSLRLELSAMEQQMVAQKRALASQLEVIRADMIEREAIFEQVGAEHAALQEAFERKLQQLGEEQGRVENLQKKMEALNIELAEASTQVEARSAQLKEVEEEKIIVLKQQSYLQECVSQKEKQLNEQCSRYNELADKLRKVDERCLEKDQLIEGMTQERSSLEVQLTSSRKEKEALDKYIANLKGDMIKVEESFRSLRSELGSKASELGHVRAMRDDVSKELEDTRTALAEKEEAVTSLSRANQEASRALAALQTENEGLQGDLGMLRSRLEAAELRVAELEAALARTSEERDALEKEVTAGRAELQSVKANVRDLRSEVEVLRAEHAKYMELLQTHEALKGQLKTLLDEHHALTVRYSTETNDLRAKIDEEVQERERLVRENAECMRELQGQLEELSGTKESLESRIADLVEQHDTQIQSQVTAHTTQMELVSLEMSGITEAKRRVEEECETARSHLQELTTSYNEQLMACRSEMVALTERAQLCSTYEDRNKDLSLELERTRGKIDALLQTAAQLKQHASLLEDALAKREGSLVELASQSQDCLRRSEEERAGIFQRLTEAHQRQQVDEVLRTELSEQLNYHRTMAQKLRLEAGQMKDEKERLGDQLTDSLANADRLGQQVEALEKARAEDAAALDRLRADRAELERQLAGLRSLREDEDAAVERRRLELECLEQQLEQRSGEIAALEARIVEITAKHREELEKMKDIVEGVNRELAIVKGELETVRKEKLEYQSRLAHLRGALKAAIQRYRLFSEAGEEGGLRPELDLSQLEKLLEDSGPLQPSKPLMGLSRCLEGLRAEIDGLQTNMNEQVKAVHSSAGHWRQLESQTEELRKTCAETKMMIAPSDA